MVETNSDLSLSNTRGASLAHLTALCFILGNISEPLNVKSLANEAIRLRIFNFDLIPRGGRLPTRIHHHMIALRKVGLVRDEQKSGNSFYSLTTNGRSIFDIAKQENSDNILEFNNRHRAAWRPVLVDSAYIRYQWLKYFMSSEEFDYRALLAHNSSVSFYRIPLGERVDRKLDSGYRLVSSHWDEREISTLEYREIYQGLRRWTNEVYLTDDRIPDDLNIPYLHQMFRQDYYEIDSCIVTSWLDTDKDIAYFEKQVDKFMEERRISRISIPELIIGLCDENNYSKHNVRELLEKLYYTYSYKYFFERGSQFLVSRAFDVAKPEDYYVKIEGVWRTGLVKAEI